MPDYTPVTAFSPGGARPAHATALGKALLAFAASDVLRLAATASMPAYTRTRSAGLTGSTTPCTASGATGSPSTAAS
jgi:DNA-binding IclR family transcriptional regulator